MTSRRHEHEGMSLLDYVNELTRAHTHREHYTQRIGATTYGQDHVTTVPPLLHQLRYATPTGLGEERGGTGYESRPAASLDALDTLARIEHQASTWLTTLTPAGVKQPRDLLDVLRRLGALHVGMVDATLKRALERDVRHWWAQARVIAGLDTPAWRPRNSCPMCGERGSLRVKFADKVGLCVECRETWTEANIGLLADHIREESAAEHLPIEVTACWCPWPRPPFVFNGRWGAFCSVCGSRHCHRVSRKGVFKATARAS